MHFNPQYYIVPVKRVSFVFICQTSTAPSERNVKVSGSVKDISVTVEVSGKSKGDKKDAPPSKSEDNKTETAANNKIEKTTEKAPEVSSPSKATQDNKEPATPEKGDTDLTVTVKSGGRSVNEGRQRVGCRMYSVLPRKY